jgi:hypothetical protein
MQQIATSSAPPCSPPANDDDWESYDITPILRHIATYIIVPQK